MIRKTTKREQAGTASEAQPAPEPEIIVSTPLRGELLPTAVICALLGLFTAIGPWLTLPDHKTDSTITAVLCSGIGIFFLGITGVILVSLREYVRADNDGLQGRRWRGQERFIAWADVDDYYATVFSIAQAQQSCAGLGGKITGRDGTQITFVRGWSDTSLLAKRIKARAVSAKAHDWTIKGARPHDNWSCTFHYRTWENRIAPWVAVPLLLGGATYLSVCIYRSTAAYIPFVGWAYCATFTLLFGGACWLIAGFLTFLIVPDKLTRARRHQQITLTRDGITFHDGDGVVFVGWEQITAARLTAVCCLRPCLCILETDAGTIAFTPRLRRATLLSRAIIYNAPRVHEWRLPEDSNALPTRHVASSSGFVHHYRTYSNRLWIILGWSFPTCLWLATAAELSLNVEARLLWLALFFTAVCVVPLLWLGWCYKTVRIERDEDGLAFHTAFGVSHLLWSQITDFRQRDFGRPRIYTIESRAGRFVFCSGISESDRLIRATEAHLATPVAIAENDALSYKEKHRASTNDKQVALSLREE